MDFASETKNLVKNNSTSASLLWNATTSQSKSILFWRQVENIENKYKKVMERLGYLQIL